MTRGIRSMGIRPSARQLQKIADRDARYAAMRANSPPMRGPVVTCAAETCGQPVERGQLFCKPHWFSLPEDLRKSILITFRHRIEQDFGALVRKAMDLINADSRATREHRSRRAEAILYGAPDLDHVLGETA